MSYIRAQVISRREQDLPRDHVTNTFFLNDLNLPGSTSNWQSIANDIRALWNQRGYLPSAYGHEVKVYDMADGMPRPIKATAPWVLAPTAAGASAPREVALCLSFFSERNIKRFRGRLYIGPFSQASMAERPTVAVQDMVRDLGEGIANLGGIDVDWQLFSPSAGTFRKVTNGWVDNEWDTVRSRGLRGTERLAWATGE